MSDPAGERTPRRRGRAAADGTGGSADRTGDAAGRARSRSAGGSSGRTREDPGADSATAKVRSPGGRSRGSAAAGTTAAGGRSSKRPRKARAGKGERAGSATTVAEETEPPVRGPGGRWPMADRSVLSTVLGVPPLAAVGLAAALTAVGVLVDLTQFGSLGTVFTVCHVSGCVLAVAWVRRTGLFGPMVQPPLLVALSVPVVVLLADAPRPGQGVAERLLVIGAPLVNAFPVMAWATGIVLAFGVARMVLQRPVEPAVSGRSGRGAARGAARTSASPRRS